MNRPPHSFRPSFPSHEVRRMSLLPSPRPPPPNDWKGGYHEREPYERHGPRGWNEEGRDYQGDEYFDYNAWPQIQNRPPSCIPPTKDLPYERIRISPTRREGPRPLMAGISHSVQPVREYRIRQHDSDYDYGFDNDPREVAGSSLPPWRMPPCVDWHNEPSRAEDWDEQGGWPYDGPRRVRGRPVPLMDETPSSRPGSLPREWASERLHPGSRAAHPRLLHEESMPGVHPLIDNLPYDKPSVQGDGPPAGGMHVSVHEYWHGGRTDTEGVPSPAQKNDFLGRRPPKFPHTCTLCVRPISGVKDWNAHLKGKVHQTLCQELLARYPNWKPEKWMTNENRAKAEKTTRSKPVGTDKVQVEEMDLDDSGDEASNKNADANSASNARSVEADTAGNGVGRSTTNSAANSSGKSGESELEKYKMLLSKEREVNKLLQQRLHQYYEDKQSSQGEIPSFDNYPAKKELPTEKEQFQLQSARQTRIPFGFR
uniref:U1-type domain-containing protein n=1 Tax=Eptatretus burgeri TaxID=7764 RepID=A0A8C4QD62_EPTBU